MTSITKIIMGMKKSLAVQPLKNPLTQEIVIQNIFITFNKIQIIFLKIKNSVKNFFMIKLTLLKKILILVGILVSKYQAIHVKMI